MTIHQTGLSDTERESWSRLVSQGISRSVAGLTEMVGTEVAVTRLDPPRRIAVKDAADLVGGAEALTVAPPLGSSPRPAPSILPPLRSRRPVPASRTGRAAMLERRDRLTLAVPNRHIAAEAFARIFDASPVDDTVDAAFNASRRLHV